MEVLFKYCSALVVSLVALIAPIQSLIICVVLFIGIDFVSGVWASSRVARRDAKAWYFESAEAWRTLYKLGFTLVVVVLTWLIDSVIISFMDLRLAHLFTGFVCGVELWSFLENVSQISDAPYFEWMRKYLRRRIEKEVGDVK